jgi:hypothetical protein
MSEKQGTRTKGKLAILAGLNDSVHEIDGSATECYAGQPVEDALGKILDEYVKDPEVRAMLRAPRVVLELYGRDGQGEPAEMPLSPQDDWQRVLDVLQEADAELGIARSHEGGR